MADTTDNALRACVKALNDAVLPAVDPADPLAGEQLRLVAGYLKFIGGRLEYLHERGRFELLHHLALAQHLAADARLASGAVAARLDAAIAQAQQALAAAPGAQGGLRVATSALTTSISALVRVVATAEAPLRRRVEQTVLAGSRPWVDLQRAWFAPLGFELFADQLPPLAQALAAPLAPPDAAGG